MVLASGLVVRDELRVVSYREVGEKVFLDGALVDGLEGVGQRVQSQDGSLFRIDCNSSDPEVHLLARRTNPLPHVCLKLATGVQRKVAQRGLAPSFVDMQVPRCCERSACSVGE